MTVDEIVAIITNLPLNSALIYLVAQGITTYGPAGYEKIKKIIIDKQNEGKYAFVPDKNEVLILEELKDAPDYQRILILVPNYKYIDLIRTGLLLREYNKKIDSGIDSEKNKQNIGRIKSEITRRPGGGRLIKIVKLPASNFFSVILSYLYELKIHGYPENQLEAEFNDIVDEWEKCTRFIDSATTLDGALGFCKRMVDDNNYRFFLLALYEDHINLVERTIINLNGTSILKNNDYLTKVEKEDRKGATPKIEVMFYKDPNKL